MNPRLTTWLLAGALLTSLALHARGWSRAAPAPAAPDVAALGLTDAQLDRLQADCASCCAEREIMTQELDDKQAELRAALAIDPIDRARCERLADEVGRLHASCLKNAIDTLLRVRGVLAPRQLEALEAWQPAR